MASSITVQPDTILKETTVSTNTNEAPKKISKGHRCYFCGQKFMDKNDLRKHVSSHKDRDHFCDVCGKGFYTTAILKKHMKIHTGERQFLCDKCPKTFVYQYSLFHHIKTVHDSGIIDNFCKSCGKKLRSRLNKQCWLCKYLDKQIPKDGKIPVRSNIGFELIEVNNTQNVEMGSSMYISEKTSNKDIVYNVNIRRESNNWLHKNKIQNTETNAYICHHCKAELHDSNSMKEHLQQTHPNLAKYVCEKCGRDFVEKNSLFRHTVVHTKDRPFICKVCQLTFKRLQSLKKHAYTHDQCRRAYSCKECRKVFKSLQGVKEHVIIHTRSKRLACNQCDKTFDFKANLQRHLRMHTGERPYKCNYCDKTFAQSCNLKAHEQTHQKSFKLIEETCNVCGKTFRSLSNFKKHQLICC